VPEHDEVSVLGLGFQSGCGIAQSATSIARRIAPARVRAAVRERGGEVRMDPTKRSNRERIAEHVSQGAVALVLGWAEAVAVFDMGSPATDLASPWTEHVLHADVSS